VAQLILMRHAAALPAASGAADFERPLSALGRAAAAQAARELAAAGVEVERLLFSPARRTADTAAIVAHELSLGAAALQVVPDLYAAGVQGIRESIERLHGDARVLMLIGHNPGISEMGRELASALSHAHLRTAEFWRLPFDAGRWPLLRRPAEA